MKAVAVIPARYASTRLPGKPLLDICGKPLIQRVWEIVSHTRGLDDIVVATDDDRIADAVQAFGGKVCMTSPECKSGSDRVREVAKFLAVDVYVNVQGDEPLLEPSAIETLLAVFTQDKSVQVATLCSRISEEQARSPHQVKVVRDHAGNALYFSRAPLPFVREATESAVFLGHIGIYAYRADALRGFASLPPSPLEQTEKLEQLRFLQAGIPIRVLEVPLMGAGVDTPEDLERVRAVARERRRAAALEKLKRVRLVITDVDGVLTDGGLYYGSDGECLKRFHARDGLGVRLLQQAGIQVAVLSGLDCPALRKRLADLGITEAVLGQLDKRAALSGIMERCGVAAEEVAFIGDDIPDMEVFGLCGVSVTVGDAPDYVKARADLVLECKGGQGAFREQADEILGKKAIFEGDA
nr:3-deoxy-manno-octulosonate cytidylyltransferase [uncultured Desulfovibrio sp.]